MGRHERMHCGRLGIVGEIETGHDVRERAVDELVAKVVGQCVPRAVLVAEDGLSSSDGTVTARSEVYAGGCAT